jgi:dTDP-4-amino-4,6-dideoxygalactose transaminase
MSEDNILFNKSYIAGKELFYVADAVIKGDLKGDGSYTKKCHQWLENSLECKKALLTHSCTAALEMSALLFDLKPGDEVLVPSYAFPSTANAFYLRGAKIVFVDVRADTINLDESLIEKAITKKTKAICALHYAGVSCEMDPIMQIAKKYNLRVVEDAAQAIFSSYKGRKCGTLGDLAAFSFHETKNLSSGEGGALIINDPAFCERSEIIREKGTNRSKFFRGEVDKYSWVDLGSSYLPSEVLAAFLYGQLEQAENIQSARRRIWQRYNQELAVLQEKECFRMPIIPATCEQNFHMFYLLCRSETERDDLMYFMRENGVHAVFHYFPLHLSKMGQDFGYKEGDFAVSESIASRIIRLPMYCSLSDQQQTKIIGLVENFYQKKVLKISNS